MGSQSWTQLNQLSTDVGKGTQSPLLLTSRNLQTSAGSQLLHGPRGAGNAGDHALLHRERLVSGTATRPGQPCWAETGPRGELRLGGRGLPSPSAPNANRVAASWEPCGLKGLDS